MEFRLVAQNPAYIDTIQQQTTEHDSKCWSFKAV
jgi:hypothetical protein